MARIRRLWPATNAGLAPKETAISHRYSLSSADRRTLPARIREIQQVNPTIGFDYSRFPGDRWEHAHRESDKHLALVAKLARDKAKYLANEKRTLDEAIDAAP